MKRYVDDGDRSTESSDSSDDSSSTASDSSDDGDERPAASDSHNGLYVGAGIVLLLLAAIAVYFILTSSSVYATSASSAASSGTSDGSAGHEATASGTAAGSQAGTAKASGTKTASAAPSSSSASAASSGNSTSTSSLPPNGIKAGIAGGDGFDHFADKMGWWYDWNADGSGDHTADGVSYMSMLWGDGHVDSTDKSRFEAFGSLSTAPAYILGFNEPDLSNSVASSNVSASDAAKLWEEKIAPWAEKRSLLGSPACGMQGGETWLPDFQSGITTMWDFTAVHIYQSTTDGVQKDHYVQYNKPLVITEWGMMDVSTGFDPIRDQEAINDYITACVELFEKDEHVFGYAAIMDGSGLGDVWPLVKKDGSLSESGVTYLAAISKYR